MYVPYFRYVTVFTIFRSWRLGFSDRTIRVCHSQAVEMNNVSLLTCTLERLIKCRSRHYVFSLFYVHLYTVTSYEGKCH